MQTRIRSRFAVPVLALALCAGAVPAASAQESGEGGETGSWLPSLITETPEEGFALAVTLARRGVSTTQPDTDILHALRENYAREPGDLIAASQVVAIHFQTIAAANDYWR